MCAGCLGAVKSLKYACVRENKHKFPFSGLLEEGTLLSIFSSENRKVLEGRPLGLEMCVHVCVPVCACASSWPPLMHLPNTHLYILRSAGVVPHRHLTQVILEKILKRAICTDHKVRKFDL